MYPNIHDTIVASGAYNTPPDLSHIQRESPSASLNMLLGALADGSDSALYYADKLFEGVQKTNLISCSTFTGLGDDTLQVLQAAVIGQTFAILSAGRSRL